MNKLLLLLTLSCLLSSRLHSQDQDKSIELDILRAPSSPASNLLGIATTDIDKPTDISSFMVSIQSSSSSVTTFPSNYAIDFSPYYLFKKGKTDFTTNGLQEKDFKNIFKQTFIISLAISNPDSTSTSYNFRSTYGGLGFKFSICRGNYDSITKTELKKIIDIQNDINDISMNQLTEFLESNEYKELEKKRTALYGNLDFNNPNDLPEIEKVKNSSAHKNLDQLISEKQTAFEGNQKNLVEEWLKKNDKEYLVLLRQKTELEKNLLI